MTDKETTVCACGHDLHEGERCRTAISILPMMQCPCEFSRPCVVTLNAAESLPAQPEHPRADCEGCNKPDCPCNSGEGDEGWMGMFSNNSVESVAPVEATAETEPLRCTCGARLPIDISEWPCKACVGNKEEVEPKPTPSAPADEPCEWYGRNVGPHNWIDTPDGWKRCANCKREYKPQPDSSSISTERQAQEIARIIIERDEFHEAWKAAGETAKKQIRVAAELRKERNQHALNAVEMMRQRDELASLHASIIDQGRKVLNATSDIGMSHAEFIEWVMRELEGNDSTLAAHPSPI